MRGFVAGLGIVAIGLISLQLGKVGAQEDASKPEYYTAKVKPILEANCANCHMGENRKGGLNFETREGLMKGGRDGVVVVAGDPANSLLVKLIRHEGPADDPDADASQETQDRRLRYRHHLGLDQSRCRHAAVILAGLYHAKIRLRAMLLSFVIPAYNEEAYLPACLESIVAQTKGLEGIEIIVVNNASVDRTREVALEFPGVKVVDEPRKGLTFARQAGFAACTGELVANVDSDSRLTPGWVETVLREFERQPKLVALSGPIVYYDLTPKQRLSVKMFYLIAYVVYGINRYILRAGSMVQGGNFVLKRSALASIGGFDVTIAFYGGRYGYCPAHESAGQGGIYAQAEDVLVRAATEERRHDAHRDALHDQLFLDDVPQEAVHGRIHRHSRTYLACALGKACKVRFIKDFAPYLRRHGLHHCGCSHFFATD